MYKIDRERGEFLKWQGPDFKKNTIRIWIFFFSGTVQNPENPNALMINPAQTLMLVQALQKVKETASKVGTGT